jgi:hypothetical protein
LQDPPKFTQIGILGFKTDHLATLLPIEFCRNIAATIFVQNYPRILKL